MKTLLKKVFIFLLIPLIYFSFNILFNYYQIKKSKPIIPVINYLILGDSHIQGTIDSDYFNNAVNYAKSGEPYFITYWKLKFLISHPNVSLDTVLLGFSHHDISKSKDEALLNNGANVQFKRSYGIHYYTKKDSVDVDYYKYFNVLFRNVVAIPKLDHYHFQGQYGQANNDLTKREFYNKPPKKHSHFYKRDDERGVSRTNINYLDSIVNFCNSKDIKLLLVASPVSREYYKNIPTKFLSKFDELKSIYKLKGINTHDFSQSITEDSLFADFDHLNGKGSQQFMKRNHKFLK